MMDQFQRSDYSIGWICAIPIELAAVLAVLDEAHPNLEAADGDPNIYKYGRMGEHNVMQNRNAGRDCGAGLLDGNGKRRSEKDRQADEVALLKASLLTVSESRPVRTPGEASLMSAFLSSVGESTPSMSDLAASAPPK